MNRKKFLQVLTGIAAALGIVAAVVLVYQGGWWVAKDATNRSREISTSSNQYVASQSDAIRKIASSVAGIDTDIAKANADATLTEDQRSQLVTSLTAQRASLAAEGCDKVDTIAGAALTSAVAQFAAAECN